MPPPGTVQYSHELYMARSWLAPGAPAAGTMHSSSSQRGCVALQMPPSSSQYTYVSPARTPVLHCRPRPTTICRRNCSSALIQSAARAAGTCLPDCAFKKLTVASTVPRAALALPLNSAASAARSFVVRDAMMPFARPASRISRRSVPTISDATVAVSASTSHGLLTAPVIVTP